MNKLELTIIKENYEELSNRIFNVNKYIEELNSVLSMNSQLVDSVKFNDKQLEIFKELKEKYLKSSYFPYEDHLVKKNLDKIKLVIQTIEEKK